MFFFSYYFFQKAENNRLKKISWPKFCNIVFLFLLKIGSVGPVDQQIHLISPYNIRIGRMKILFSLQPNFLRKWDKFRTELGSFRILQSRASVITKWSSLSLFQGRVKFTLKQFRCSKSMDLFLYDNGLHHERVISLFDQGQRQEKRNVKLNLAIVVLFHFESTKERNLLREI